MWILELSYLSEGSFVSAGYPRETIENGIILSGIFNSSFIPFTLLSLG
jgi:hypothetical protein